MQQRFYKEFERDFYMKIIVMTKIPTNLVTKSFLYLLVVSWKPKTTIKFWTSW